MSNQLWCTINPSSGNGNSAVSLTCSGNPGRSSRSTTLTLVGVDVDSPKSLLVTQSGTGPFTTITAIGALSNSAQQVYIYGTSNAKQLLFRAIPGNTWFHYGITEVSTDGGSSWNPFLSGQDIAGDPGANLDYRWRMLIHINVNNTSAARNFPFEVTPLGGTKQEITITQSGADATIQVQPDYIELTADGEGTSKTVLVTSNTTWAPY